MTFLRMEQVVLTLLRILSQGLSLVGDAAIFTSFVHLSGVYMGVVELFNAGVLAAVYSCSCKNASCSVRQVLGDTEVSLRFENLWKPASSELSTLTIPSKAAHRGRAAGVQQRRGARGGASRHVQVVSPVRVHHMKRFQSRGG